MLVSSAMALRRRYDIARGNDIPFLLAVSLQQGE